MMGRLMACLDSVGAIKWRDHKPGLMQLSGGSCSCVHYPFRLIFCTGFHGQIMNDMVPRILVCLHLIPEFNFATRVHQENNCFQGEIIVAKLDRHSEVQNLDLQDTQEARPISWFFQ